MKEFIKGLFSESPGSPSSKRFIAILLSLIVCIIALVNLFSGKTPAEFIFWGIVGLIGTMTGAATFQNVKNMASKQDIAGKIIENAPVPSEETQAAKDIVQDTKKEEPIKE